VTPVPDLDLAELADHDVDRPEIAVDHAPAVSVGERLADLLEQTQEPRQVVGRDGRSGAARRGTTPRAISGQERPAVGQGAGLVDGGNARVLQLPGDLRFLAEALFHFGLAHVLALEHLDGEGAAQAQVTACHSAPMPWRSISHSIS